MKIEHLYPIWFILCAAAGALIGHFSGHGIIPGLTTAIMIAVAPIFLLILTHLLWMRWRPILPICRCGRCNHREYRYVESTDGNTGRIVRFSCPQCGRIYELSRNQFYEIAADGSIEPYMNHTKWGRWKNVNSLLTTA
jgi:hypothetical protein